MKKIYIAGSFDTPEKRKLISDLALYLRSKPENEVYVPMELSIDKKDSEGNWTLSNSEWAKKVFDSDIKALDECDEAVAVYAGWNHDMKTNTGTVFEIGYIKSTGKPLTVLIPRNVNIGSLMVMNSGNIVWYDEYLEGNKNFSEVNIEQK